MTYCFMLPIAGITLQNIIQKRSDAFTQGLMDKLMQERNTLNDPQYAGSPDRFV